MEIFFRAGVDAESKAKEAVIWNPRVYLFIFFFSRINWPKLGNFFMGFWNFVMSRRRLRLERAPWHVEREIGIQGIVADECTV